MLIIVVLYYYTFDSLDPVCAWRITRYGLISASREVRARIRVFG